MNELDKKFEAPLSKTARRCAALEMIMTLNQHLRKQKMNILKFTNVGFINTVALDCQI